MVKKCRQNERLPTGRYSMNCNDCPKRPTCRQLCPKAEAYVNQDDDPELWSDITMCEMIETYEQRPQNGLSTTEAILQELFIDHDKMPTIAERHGVSVQYVSRVHRKYRAMIVRGIKEAIK